MVAPNGRTEHGLMCSMVLVAEPAKGRLASNEQIRIFLKLKERNPQCNRTDFRLPKRATAQRSERAEQEAAKLGRSPADNRVVAMMNGQGDSNATQEMVTSRVRSSGFGLIFELKFSQIMRGVREFSGLFPRSNWHKFGLIYYFSDRNCIR